MTQDTRNTPRTAGPLKQWYKKYSARLPILPALIYLVVFMAIPLGILFVMGFIDIVRGNIVPGSFTFAHYAKVLGDPYYWKMFGQTFLMGLLATVICLIFAYPVAYYYTRVGKRLKNLIMITVMAPLLTNAVVRSFGWIIILGGPKGLLNNLLMTIGLIAEPIKFLYTFTGVIVVLVQIELPFMVIPLITGMEDMDSRLEEASMNLGASKVQTFFHVFMPLSVPGIIAGTSLVFVTCYTNYVVPALFGGGRVVVVGTYIYDQMTAVLDWNTGAVLSTLLLGSAMLFSWLINVMSTRLLKWKN